MTWRNTNYISSEKLYSEVSDRKRGENDKSFLSANFHLQAVLYCTLLQAKPIFYKQRWSVYNFTVSTVRTVIAMVWNNSNVDPLRSQLVYGSFWNLCGNTSKRLVCARISAVVVVQIKIGLLPLRFSTLCSSWVNMLLQILQATYTLGNEPLRCDRRFLHLFMLVSATLIRKTL